MKVVHQLAPGGRSASDALDRLFAVTVRLGEVMGGGLEERGLTRARAEVLWWLGSAGPITQRQLADILCVTPRNITGLVDALEASGLVTREPHPTDRRATHLTLTKRGKAMAQELRDDQAQMADDLFGDLSERAVAEVVRALDHVLTRLPADLSAHVQSDAHADV